MARTPLKAVQPARQKPAGKSADTAKGARQQRGIQREQDAKDAKEMSKKSKSAKSAKKAGAVQAGAVNYPETPLPSQRLAKPGLEAEMQLAPMYQAANYRGSGKLEGMVALITGDASVIP